MNVILVIIDTLRYDYIGANGNKWIKTPNIDRLASQSWVFHRSFTSSYPTLPHRTDVLTGTSGEPFHPWGPLAFDYLTFPRVLAEAGYATQLIHDTPHMVNGGHNFDWPFHAWTFVRGAEVDRAWITDDLPDIDNWAPDPLFDGFDEELEAVRLQTYIRTNRNRCRYEDWNCARLFRTASEWLHDNAKRQNFFLWVDCFDPHEPWDVPPEYMLMYDDTPGYDGRIDPRMFGARNHPDLSNQARKRVAASYAAKVTWMDRWLGTFLQAFEETGLSQNTALIFTADHGTNVGERGKFGKGYPLVREQEARTPFMVRMPDGDTGSSSMLVQPMDIFATVMNLAGKPTPDGLDSNDVLTLAREGKPGERGMVVASTGTKSWGTNPGTLFTAFDHDWTLEYTLKPENSTLTALGSLENVADEHPEIVRKMRAAALAELERRKTDPAILEYLRTEGAAQWPTECKFWDRYPAPNGYSSYFDWLYQD